MPILGFHARQISALLAIALMASSAMVPAYAQSITTNNNDFYQELRADQVPKTLRYEPNTSYVGTQQPTTRPAVGANANNGAQSGDPANSRTNSRTNREPTQPMLPALLNEQNPDAAQNRDAEQNPNAGQNSALFDANEHSARDDSDNGTISVPANARGQSSQILDEDRFGRARSAPKQAPIQARDLTHETNPYAPLGMRVGTFIFLPSLQSGILATSNVDGTQDGKSSIQSQSTARLIGTSQWSRHELRIESFAIWNKSISGAERNDPQLGLDASLRLDLIDDHTLTFNGKYQRMRESATSLTAAPVSNIRPFSHDLEASAAFAKISGKLRYSIKGALAHEHFNDINLSDGSTISQAARNSTSFTGTLRAGYELSPAFVPFVEASYGQRTYEENQNSAGFGRTSTQMALRLGAELDYGDQLKGEISAVWLTEKPTDQRLDAISGLGIDGNLEWSPTHGTTLALAAQSAIDTTSTSGDTGSITHTASATLSRDLMENLTASAMLSASLRNFVTDGSETTLTGELGATWWLNRNLGFDARVTHTRQNSSLPNRNANTNSIYFGLNLQR